MQLTKHAHARFKQRQNVKNEGEMMRRLSLALQRGTLVPNCSNNPGTTCLLYAGYKYIVSKNMNALITLIPNKKLSSASKRHLVDEARIKQLSFEAKLALATL